MTFDWDSLWDRKGGSDSLDPLEISGFENYRTVNTEVASQKLCDLLHIGSGDSVLEIGCGAGLLARHLQTLCHYVGTDRSDSMIKKTILLNHFSAVRCDANDLIFKDKSFDFVFAFTVFHYFPSFDYARQTVAEMIRVARRAVCVSDIPVASHDPNHLIFDESFFAGWAISETLYQREHRRFTAILELDNMPDQTRKE